MEIRNLFSDFVDKNFLKAKDYAYRLLSYRPRSIKEIEERLRSKKIGDNTIREVIRYLEELNYLNDREFARSWVTAKLSSKAVGILFLSYGLKMKGVSQDIIDEVINDTKAGSEYDEYEIAKREALNKFKRHGSSNKVESKRKLYGHLVRRGFSTEIISQVMNEILA